MSISPGLPIGPRRARFPLAAKILAWFALNCLLLIGLLVALVITQYRLPFDVLVFGNTRERLRPVLRLVEAELRERPPGEWNTALARFSEAYQVQFHVFDRQANHLAGRPIELPADVQERLIDRPWFMRRGPPEGARPEEAANPPNESSLYPRVLLRTTRPVRYWVFERFAIPPPGQPPPPAPHGEPEGRWPRWGFLPLTLVIESASVTGNGLFLDARPILLFALAGIGLSLILWWPLLHGISHAIAQLAHASRRIAAGHFDVRVADRRGDELGALAHDINTMAQRIEGLVTGQKRFLSDIAHELCAPVSRLQVSLGILEQKAADESLRYVESAQGSARHMADLVSELLSFSKAALGGDARRPEPLLLRPLIEELLEREVPESVPLSVAVPDGLGVLARPELLSRALGNLVRNAVQHGGGAPVRISAAREDGAVRIEVADEGPGIPAEDLDHVFEPFYRPDASRAAATGGTGLGLSIVKTCIEACAGQVQAVNRVPRGLAVTLTLPAANNP